VCRHHAAATVSGQPVRDVCYINKSGSCCPIAPAACANELVRQSWLKVHTLGGEFWQFHVRSYQIIGHSSRNDKHKCTISKTCNDDGHPSMVASRVTVTLGLRLHTILLLVACHSLWLTAAALTAVHAYFTHTLPHFILTTTLEVMYRQLESCKWLKLKSS